MACNDYTDYTNALSEFAFRDAIACPLIDQWASATLVATVILSGLGLALYTKTNSLTLTYVVTVLTGGIILPFFTSAAHTAFVLILLTILGAAPVFLARRMETRGGI